MKKTIYTLATAICLTAGTMLTTSCGLGTAGSAIANQALQNYLTTGSLTGGNLAATALQAIMKDQEMANVLGQIASTMIQNYHQKGTPVVYAGQANIEALSGTYEPMAYKSIGKGAPTLNVTLTGNQKTLDQSSSAMLTIPAYTVASGITTTELTIAGLTVSTANGTTSIALGDNSGFSGSPTLTVNGSEFPATTVFITEAKVVAGTLSLNMTLYYGKDYTNPINLTYTGAVK